MTHLVLIAASFLAFGPFLWMFLTSIKTYEETIQIPMKFLPEVAQWVNFSIVSDKLNFPQLYLNTILVTVMVILGQMLIVTIYWNVLLPLVKPGLTTLAILGMLSTWKDLMWPLINNSQASKMTLAAGLAMLIGEHTTYYEQVMAGGVIAVLPLIVLFVIFQRQFVEGIAHSGIKG